MQVVASVSSDSISRRLVVKNWAGIIAENSAPVIPEGSAEPSVARTPTEVLSVCVCVILEVVPMMMC